MGEARPNLRYSARIGSKRPGGLFGTVNWGFCAVAAGCACTLWVRGDLRGNGGTVSTVRVCPASGISSAVYRSGFWRYRFAV